MTSFNHIKLRTPGKDSTIKFVDKVPVIRICSEDSCDFKGMTYEPPGLEQGDHSHYCPKHNPLLESSPSPSTPPSPPGKSR